jgi:serine O-acetyltransferase
MQAMGADQTSTVSATVPDPSRERPRRGWDPGRRLLRCIRLYQASRGQGGLASNLRHRSAALAHRFWSVVTGADIPLSAEIGEGLLIPHPNGIVIHPGARIGPNCLIFQQVTIGTADGPGVPVIGGHVDIGAGAKILGPVTIGDHAKIGANAVVVTDIPEGATAVGIPARIVSA